MEEIAAKLEEWLLAHDYNEACETDDICKGNMREVLISQKRNKIIELISAITAMLQKLGTTKSGHFEAIPGSGAGSSWTFSPIQQFIQAFFECLDEFLVVLSIEIDLRT